MPRGVGRVLQCCSSCIFLSGWRVALWLRGYSQALHLDAVFSSRPSLPLLSSNYDVDRLWIKQSQEKQPEVKCRYLLGGRTNCQVVRKKKKAKITPTKPCQADHPA